MSPRRRWWEVEEGEWWQRKEDGAGQRRSKDLLPEGGERTAMGCSMNGGERHENILISYFREASRTWDKLSLVPWRW
jgi:hypothetical protein